MVLLYFLIFPTSLPHLFWFWGFFFFLYFWGCWAYVYVHDHSMRKSLVCTCVCMYTYLYTGQPVCNSSGAIYYFFVLLVGLALPETGPLAWSSPSHWLDWPARKPQDLFLCLLSSGTVSAQHHTQLFLCGFWESNSGPNTCKTSTSTKRVYRHTYHILL